MQKWGGHQLVAGAAAWTVRIWRKKRERDKNQFYLQHLKT